MKQWVREFVVLMGCILPMASFAYEATELQNIISIQPSKSIVSQPTTQWPTKNLNSAEYPGQSSPLNSQVEYLDQEILILRGELAQINADVTQVTNYINQLSRMVLLPVFQPRLASLELYLSSTKTVSHSLDSELSEGSEVYSYESSMEALQFPDPKDSSVVVILLPLTGPYAQAGNSVLAGLNKALDEQSFKGSVVVFDTALYNTMFELWEAVKYYEPDFIFGPLQKKTVRQWQTLNTGIPTFYFNSPENLLGYERALSFSRSKGLEQVFSVFNDSKIENVLVLTDSSESSQKLEAEFYQAWSTVYSSDQYYHQSVGNSVSLSVEAALNVQRSKERYLWLQKVTDSAFEFTLRARQDFDAIVTLLPQNKAVQVGPILEFHQLDNVTHVWYPSQVPNPDSLYKNISSWQKTYAVLPAYIQAGDALNKSNFLEQNKNGLFYALGRVAVEIVKNPAISDSQDLYIETEFGELASNSVGQFYLLPVIYWVDKGIFDRVTEFSEALTK